MRTEVTDYDGYCLWVGTRGLPGGIPRETAFCVSEIVKTQKTKRNDQR